MKMPLIEFDVCNQTNATTELYYANTNAQDDADAGAQRSNLSTSTITTYLKGLPRDLTNFFNFLFVRCSSVTIPYLCWFPLIVIIEATCTSIILFHFIWFLGSIFAVNYWYWFIKSHNKWFFSFSLSLPLSFSFSAFFSSPQTFSSLLH